MKSLRIIKETKSGYGWKGIEKLFRASIGMLWMWKPWYCQVDKPWFELTRSYLSKTVSPVLCILEQLKQIFCFNRLHDADWLKIRFNCLNLFPPFSRFVAEHTASWRCKLIYHWTTCDWYCIINFPEIDHSYFSM